MDSLTGHNIVDTEDRDEMMSDIADLYARSPMRTHTVGGNRHILMMFETAAKFNCDMIVMYDDIGCKGMAGCQGLLLSLIHIFIVYHSVKTKQGEGGSLDDSGAGGQKRDDPREYKVL